MNPIKKGFSWLYHYLFSNTLHGTHSPFVYAFLENIVYQPNSNKKNKYNELIARILNSRDAGMVLIFNMDDSVENAYANYQSEKVKADQNSIFIFNKIRSSEHALSIWETISKDPRNNISIDFFEIGVLFFDQKKPKEHFSIYY